MQHSFLDVAAPGEYLVPVGEEPKQCRSCGAAIIWARSTLGHPVPSTSHTSASLAGSATR